MAFFIAKRLRSNVRELEGALKPRYRQCPTSPVVRSPSILCVKRARFAGIAGKLVTIDKYSKDVAEYYKIKVADLLSKRRSRSVGASASDGDGAGKGVNQPQSAEIGDAFGGRDHTTVLHACRKIEQLREESHDIKEKIFPI